MHSGRVVIIGNAVHQLHPVAGQGFNLGLRDVVQLAENLLNAAQQDEDIGAQAMA
jgi:2-octaprenyl-6-methoxyphenol hydroxylase